MSPQRMLGLKTSLFFWNGPSFGHMLIFGLYTPLQTNITEVTKKIFQATRLSCAKFMSCAGEQPRFDSSTRRKPNCNACYCTIWNSQTLLWCQTCPKTHLHWGSRSVARPALQLLHRNCLRPRLHLSNPVKHISLVKNTPPTNIKLRPVQPLCMSHCKNGNNECTRQRDAYHHMDRQQTFRASCLTAKDALDTLAVIVILVVPQLPNLKETCRGMLGWQNFFKARAQIQFAVGGTSRQNKEASPHLYKLYCCKEACHRLSCPMAQKHWDRFWAHLLAWSHRPNDQTNCMPTQRQLGIQHPPSLRRTSVRALLKTTSCFLQAWAALAAAVTPQPAKLLQAVVSLQQPRQHQLLSIQDADTAAAAKNGHREHLS